MCWCVGSIWTQLLLSELKAKVQDFCQHIFYRESVAFSLLVKAGS